MYNMLLDGGGYKLQIRFEIFSFWLQKVVVENMYENGIVDCSRVKSFTIWFNRETKDLSVN